MPTQQVAMAQCRCGKRVNVGENAIPLATDHAFSEGKSRLDILRHVNGIQFLHKRLSRHSRI